MCWDLGPAEVLPAVIDGGEDGGDDRGGPALAHVRGAAEERGAGAGEGAGEAQPSSQLYISYLFITLLHIP